MICSRKWHTLFRLLYDLLHNDFIRQCLSGRIPCHKTDGHAGKAKQTKFFMTNPIHLSDLGDATVYVLCISNSPITPLRLPLLTLFAERNLQHVLCSALMAYETEWNMKESENVNVVRDKFIIIWQLSIRQISHIHCMYLLYLY